MKIIIIGNSGSGKTWLSNEISSITKIPVVHLDDVFWEPGGFDVKRSDEIVYEILEEEKYKTNWIVEGVFGELANYFFDEASHLIWLDLPWKVCRERLTKRGSESKSHMGREQKEEGLMKLINWASEYEVRENMRSKKGHGRMYANFSRVKFRIIDERSIEGIIRLVCLT